MILVGSEGRKLCDEDQIQSISGVERRGDGVPGARWMQRFAAGAAVFSGRIGDAFGCRAI